MNSNNQKTLLVALLVLLVGGVSVYAFTLNSARIDDNTSQSDDTNNGIAVGEPNPSGNRVIFPSTTQDQPIGKLKVVNFTGKLEQVNTGCFADGECYVVVGGKHITTLMGWSRETVGSVMGVEGFGDLESHVGEQIEVYAQDKGDGSYTLYGNSGFYIKLIK